MKSTQHMAALFVAIAFSIAWSPQAATADKVHAHSSGDKLPEFGLGYYADMDTTDLVKLWSSDNPAIRNTSALEVARRVWKSEDPTATLKTLMPAMTEALKSDSPNRRRAVADMVTGLAIAGGKYSTLKVKMNIADKTRIYAKLREQLGTLLPIVCKNIKDDPHTWARAGACDLASNIIRPYNLPADDLYDEYAEKIRPLLITRAHDDDRFMQQAAGRALNAVGIGDLDPAAVTRAMFVLIETRISQSCTEAFNVLAQLEDKDLDKAVPFLLETVKSDAIDANHSKPGVVACQLLLRSGSPKAPAAVIDYVTRDRHGQGYREMELFPLIREFSDKQLRSALPQLRSLALIQEFRGRRYVSGASQTFTRLKDRTDLSAAEKVQLDNARQLVENPPHKWILDLFTRIGEEPPKVGVEVTGPNPDRDARTTKPKWIPDEDGERVPVGKTDGLVDSRAMDVLPGRKAKVLPIDETAFSKIAPETNCRNLTIQIANPAVVLRRPMGPTGILGTFSARRICVLATQPGSPSHGKLFNGDWILGVNGRYFTHDPRVGMGWAIEESEGRRDGAMQLSVLREGKVTDVTIRLQPLGRFSSTWPYNCEKSNKIFDNACEFIARHDANWVIPGALVLLASGDDRYMPQIRRQVYALGEQGPTDSNWFMGYRIILLAEYYLRTGDSGVLPILEKFTRHVTDGQTYPGGYLHNVSRFNEWKMATKIGYGEMNMAGAPCMVGLVLANECGIKMNHNAFRKTIKYFDIFAGRGCVPYGAHAPWIRSTGTGGKTAIIGVGFDLLGRKDIAKPMVDMSATGHEYMWTGYHGATYWNAVWRPLAAARSSADAFTTLSTRHTWIFNLSRQFHGGMTSPARNPAEFVQHHNPTQSPGYALIYALPRKALRITGAPPSKRTSSASAKVEPVTDAEAEFSDIMRRLQTGPESFASKDCLALAEMAGGTGDLAKRAQAMMKYYAVPADGRWPEITVAAVENVSSDQIGKLFYLISPSLDEIRRMRMKSWTLPIGSTHPVDDLETNPDLRNWYRYDYDDSKWDNALGPYLLTEDSGYEHDGFVLQRMKFEAKYTVEIEDIYLKARLGPRYFRGMIYLNGEAIMEFSESPCGRERSRGHRHLGQKTVFIKLPKAAKTLIKEGNNILAVRGEVPPMSNWSHAWLRMVDVGLAATRQGGGSWSYDPMIAGE